MPTTAVDWKLSQIAVVSRPALGPLRHPNPGMDPFLEPFPVGMGPFGRSGGSKFRCGSQIPSSFLGLSPSLFCGVKNVKV